MRFNNRRQRFNDKRMRGLSLKPAGNSYYVKVKANVLIHVFIIVHVIALVFPSFLHYHHCRLENVSFGRNKGINSLCPRAVVDLRHDAANISFVRWTKVPGKHCFLRKVGKTDFKPVVILLLFIVIVVLFFPAQFNCAMDTTINSAIEFAVDEARVIH